MIQDCLDHMWQDCEMVTQARGDAPPKVMRHPQAICKHAPRHLIEGGKGGNIVKVKPGVGKKKPAVNPEVERLRALLRCCFRSSAGLPNSIPRPWSSSI